MLAKKSRFRACCLSLRGGSSTSFRISPSLNGFLSVLNAIPPDRAHLVLTIVIRIKFSTLATAPYTGPPWLLSGLTTRLVELFSDGWTSVSNGFMCSKLVMIPRRRLRSSIPCDVQAREIDPSFGVSLCDESACFVGVPETAQCASEQVLRHRVIRPVRFWLVT